MIDSESPSSSAAFDGAAVGDVRFDLGILVSRAEGLRASLERSAHTVVPVDPTPDATHSIARQWCERAGLGAGVTPPTLGPDDRRSPETSVILHPGSGSSAKNWPIDRFRSCAAHFRAENWRVVWLTGPADAAQDMMRALRDPADDHLNAPALATLRDRLAVCGLFVGNDSGPAHLAAACGAPTIVIYGPTDPVVWAPDGARVATVRAESGRLDDVRVDAVLSAARNLQSPDLASRRPAS